MTPPGNAFDDRRFHRAHVSGMLGCLALLFALLLGAAVAVHNRTFITAFGVATFVAAVPAALGCSAVARELPPLESVNPKLLPPDFVLRARRTLRRHLYVHLACALAGALACTYGLVYR